MNWVLKQQIRWNVKVYVDDMVVKSRSISQHVADLEEVFGELRKYSISVNPEKYAFRVGGGKFFGFMITPKSALLY